MDRRMSDELEIEVAGAYPIRFGSCLTSTGPKEGDHQNGMSFDSLHSWDGKMMFCGGVISFRDVIRLKIHLEHWIGRRALALDEGGKYGSPSSAK